MSITQYIVGLDLGQAADPTALAVLEQTRPEAETEAAEAEAAYAVRELRRWPLGTPYPTIVAEVVRLTQTAPLFDCELVIDGTGCGRAVVDLFRQAGPRASIRPMLITAGVAVSTDEYGYLHVAKIQLVSTMQALLGTRRLRHAKGLALTKTVEKELQNFRAKITSAGNETFEADWRQGAHDDLVLAEAMACWVGENVCLGPWTVTDDPGSRSIIASAPEGVFLDYGGSPGDFYGEEPTP